MNYKLTKYCVEIERSGVYVYLFNSVTGGIIKLEKDLYDSLRGKLFDNGIKFFSDLKRMNYVVPASKDEYKFLKYNEMLASNQLYNINCLSYVFAPTLSCNLKCVYCFETNSVEIQKPKKSTLQAIVEFIVVQVEKIKTIKNVNFNWFGGEPLLCYDELLEFGDMLRAALDSKHIKFSSRIITNGILLTKERVFQLKIHCNLESAQITIDGLHGFYCIRKRATQSQFESVIKNITEIKNDIDVWVRLNADKKIITNYIK